MLTDLNRMDFRNMQQVRYFETFVFLNNLQYILNNMISYKCHLFYANVTRHLVEFFFIKTFEWS